MTACGGYRVSVSRGRIIVRCRACGPSTLSKTGARRLAAVLGGPLARFETKAPRADRLQLAADLRRVARRSR